MTVHRWFAFNGIKIASFGDYILSGTSNLESGSASKREVKYIDADGTDYKDILYNKRSFEISGFIRAFDENTMVELKRKLIAACSLKKKFRLEYFNRQNTYSAECYFDQLPTFSERKQWHLPFKLYLTIPGFYWQSGELYTPVLYSCENEVFDTFTLPCVFTKTIDEAMVINQGDVEVYPTFIVTCEKEIEGSTILITNNTTQKSIFVNHSAVIGERIVIDTYNKTVKSNVSGEITDKISIDTEFFELLKGENCLTSLSEGNVVTLEFRENFLGV